MTFAKAHLAQMIFITTSLIGNPLKITISKFESSQYLYWDTKDFRFPATSIQACMTTTTFVHFNLILCFSGRLTLLLVVLRSEVRFNYILCMCNKFFKKRLDYWPIGYAQLIAHLRANLPTPSWGKASPRNRMLIKLKLPKWRDCRVWWLKKSPDHDLLTFEFWSHSLVPQG